MRMNLKVLIFVLMLILISIVPASAQNQTIDGYYNPSIQNCGPIFGVMWAADDIDNEEILGVGGRIAYRFISDESASIMSFRWHNLFGASGYSAGDLGGPYEISIRPDDGSGNPDMNVNLGTSIWSDPDKVTKNSTSANFPYVTFNNSIPVIAGNTYYIVFQNNHADPSSNWVSVDGPIIWGGDQNNQPCTGYNESALIREAGMGNWFPLSNRQFDHDIGYSNGRHQGQGYIHGGFEKWYRPVEGVNMVRERIAVTHGDICIKDLNLRLNRGGKMPAGPLQADLMENGKLIDTIRIPPGDVFAGCPFNSAYDYVCNYGINASQNGDYSAAIWPDGPHQLKQDHTYDIQLSAPAGNPYIIPGIGQGRGYGYHTDTYFEEGFAQQSTNGGATWGPGWQVAWQSSPASLDVDLQMYMSVDPTGESCISIPVDTATSTPKPTTTSTSVDIATNTPEPTATNTPEPTATNTPEPTATNTPLIETPVSINPTSTPPSSSSGCHGLEVEAEEGILSGNFVVARELTASEGSYVHVPRGKPTYGISIPEDDKVSYCVTIQEAGNYRIKTIVHGPSPSFDSFFVRINGAPQRGYIWDIRTRSGFMSEYVTQRGKANQPFEVELNAGKHTIEFFLREPDSRLDKFNLELVDASTVFGQHRFSSGNMIFLPAVILR